MELNLKINKQRLAPFVFISPFFILLLIFGIFPVGFNIFLSFTRWNGMALSNIRFMGLTNYKFLLSNRDPYFWKTVGITGWLLLFGSLTQHIFAIPLAILLNNKLLRGRNIFRTAYFMPYITSTVSISIIFTMFYAYEAGMFNWILGIFNIPPLDWLQSRETLPLAVAILINWKYIGWNTIIYLAGLQSIPSELYESAEIDGAPLFTKHVHITIPMLAPIIFFAVTISIIGGMQLFIEPFVLTRGYDQMGGGGNSVFTVAFYIMWLLQRGARLGKGAAVSWLLFIIVVIMTFFNRYITDLLEGKRVLKKRKEIKASDVQIAEDYE